MRYSVRYKAYGKEIRTENAAQSIDKASRILLAWLEQLPASDDILDFGCGRLRYASILAAKANRLTLVDSEVQLNRKQRIRNAQTTIRQYALDRWPNVRVLTYDKFLVDRRRYNFVLCANVLSVIPNRQIRSEVLQALLAKLKRAGRALFVTQYRHASFSDRRNRPDAQPYLDGWILRTSQRTSYYGTLDKYRLSSLVHRHGFQIDRAWTSDKSAYVLAVRPNG